jgi:hypothetical protein
MKKPTKLVAASLTALAAAALSMAIAAPAGADCRNVYARAQDGD